MFEIIFAENRVVVNYPYEDLVVLGGYEANGKELSHDHLVSLSTKLGSKVTKNYLFESLSDLLSATGKLGREAEGFVVKFNSGLRLKFKGEEYRKLHRLVSGITPLGVWEQVESGVDLAESRKEIPEEFWEDFDNISSIFNTQITEIIKDVDDCHSQTKLLSDKEIGLTLNKLSNYSRSLIFIRRKLGEAWLKDFKAKKIIHKFIRPTNNRLKGYEPSRLLNRVKEES